MKKMKRNRRIKTTDKDKRINRNNWDNYPRIDHKIERRNEKNLFENKIKKERDKIQFKYEDTNMLMKTISLSLWY